MKNESQILNGILIALAVISLGVAGATVASGEINVDNIFLVTLCLALAATFAITPALSFRKTMMAEAAQAATAEGPVIDVHQDHTIYYIIWGGLLFLTVVEIVLAYFQLGIKIMLVTLLGLSFVKSGMIMAYFMHLKFERKSLVLTLIPITVVLIALFSIFFPDSLR